MTKDEYQARGEKLAEKFEAAKRALFDLEKELVTTKEAIGAEDSVGLADIKYGLMNASDVYVAIKFEQALEKIRDAKSKLTTIITGAREVANSAFVCAMLTDPEVKNDQKNA